jgi:hypothetical protein
MACVASAVINGASSASANAGAYDACFIGTRKTGKANDGAPTRYCASIRGATGPVRERTLGAKTALLAFTDADLIPVLRHATACGVAEAEEVVRLAHPGFDVVRMGESTLFDWPYPPDDITYATVLAGAEVLCDRRLVFNRPSDLPPHLRAAGIGRRIIMHGMHSGVDWLCFAVWEDGELVRSLSLSPDSGIVENIGEPYAFELPFWAGAHPVVPGLELPDQGPYPLPFHPLELGEEALRALFGFVIEGTPDPVDLDAQTIALHGFRVTDPTRQQQAQREAAYQQARERMGPPRRFRIGPDGMLQDVSLDTP